MITLSPDQVKFLRDCIKHNLEDVLPRKKGYSVCNLLSVDEEADKDVLTLVRILTATTYLMGKHRASDVAFVHFTNKAAAKQIQAEGFAFIDNEYSDYGDALCCFRIDAMSRGFGTPSIDTAVIFVYSGTYYSCIRQEDSDSNIGYQIIEKEDVRKNAIKILDVISCEEFHKNKQTFPLNAEQILIHHGMSPCSKYAHQLKDWDSLSSILPGMYREYIDTPPEQACNTNLF